MRTLFFAALFGLAFGWLWLATVDAQQEER